MVHVGVGCVDMLADGPLQNETADVWKTLLSGKFWDVSLGLYYFQSGLLN